MGRTKELLQQMNEANQMVDDSYQYNEWLESDEFIEYVNRELDTTKLQILWEQQDTHLNRLP